MNIIEKLFVPFWMLIPTVLFGMLPAALQFFFLPLNLIGIRSTDTVLLHAFGSIASIVVIGICLILAVRKDFWLILPVLFIGFALSALYTSLPLLLDMKRDITTDGFLLLGPYAALLFLAGAGVLLMAFGKGTQAWHACAWTLMVVGFGGYLLYAIATLR